jgi:hypothetical protein
MSSTPPPQVRALNCPKCGAPLVIRGFETTLSVVCENCLSVLDAKDPNLAVLQQFQARTRIKPLIPLGTRGKVRGDAYEVIGFQVRTIVVDLTEYSWSEYLLFNPYKGFRYLTEYQGHWNDVTVLRTLPEVNTAGLRPVAKFLGETYRHFQTAEAETTYVLGEFPWQVRVGEKANVMDFVSPPRMLSREATGEEVVWSLGEYMPGPRVWEAFRLPGHPPTPVGVFENQPSPAKGGLGEMWVACLFFLLCLLLASLVFLNFDRQEQVFHDSYYFAAGAAREPSFVTPVFELQGRTSNVELAIHTDLANNWAYFNFALINAETGEASDFGREVSYYYGRDSDGAWTEGGPNDHVFIPSVPSGRYYLRVEPEMDRAATHGVRYELALTRDVPAMSFFWIAALLLLIPPGFMTFRSLSFEQARWKESDYAPASASDGDDD